jgi:hypothetical protein
MLAGMDPSASCIPGRTIRNSGSQEETLQPFLLS